MSAKTEREKAIRAQAMALPPAQQKILLAYLAGYAANAVESGLEFLASLGVADVTGAAEAETPAAHEPAPAPAPVAVVPCGDTRPHWPHARCMGIPVALADPGRHLTPAASEDDDRPINYLACGDQLADTALIEPGTAVICPRHGQTHVITLDRWLDEHPPGGPSPMHPGGYALTLAGAPR